MKLYRFSPISSPAELSAAMRHIHLACHELCLKSFGKYLPQLGNIGVFCHYEEEFNFLLRLREALTHPSTEPDQKYFELIEPIAFPKTDEVPESRYTHIYIRKPDPYRHHVGDIDFTLEPDIYNTIKQSLLDGAIIPGARVFPRADLDMIELYHPDIDVLAYVSVPTEGEKVRLKTASKLA